MENKLLQFQKTIGVIAKDSKNPHFKNTYASLTQILSEVKPILTSLELVLLQPINNNKVGSVILSGDTIIAESWIDLPTGLQPQPLGSAITYFRRYTLSSLLSLEIDDDDAQMTNKQVPSNNAYQAQQSIKLIESCVSIGELQAMWQTLDQKLTGVKEAKDAMKIKLTNNGISNS